MDIPSLWQELEQTLTPILAGFRSKRSLRIARKADTSLLSEADEAVQAEIIVRIRSADPDGLILGEERAHGSEGLPGRAASSRVWVIDPIDGTAQFVSADSREFCSVVCLLEDRRPVAAFVLAPEIGPGRSPVCVRLSGPDLDIEVNGRRAVQATSSSRPSLVSVTRSSGTAPRTFERLLGDGGYQLKTRTTSQTLDMVRTCIDLTSLTKPPLEPFGLFYRQRQKLWDGVAGMCFAYAAGLHVVDGSGRVRTEVDIDMLADDPVFDSTLIASDSAAAQIIVGVEVRR